MKSEMPLAEAREIAQHIAATLTMHAQAFSRVEIAGSIRRKKPTVGDIEIVAQIDPNLEFGSTGRIIHALAGTGVHRAGPITRKDGIEVSAPWSERYMKGVYARPGLTDNRIQVDLFIVRPPAEWGVVFLIRTGSAKFSEAMVTRLHRYGVRSQDGRIVNCGVPDGTEIPCSTEDDFFRLAHLPFIQPEKRDMSFPETEREFTVHE